MEDAKKGREQPGSGQEETPAPADEYEALRAQLLARLRRQPAETRSLMRMASELSRIESAQKRLSPRRREELAANIEAVLDRFGDLILPADR